MRTYLKNLKDLKQSYDRLKTGQEYLATERVTGIADGAETINFFVGLDSDCDVDALVGIGLNPGGQSHVDVGNNATVDTAGTDMEIQSKGDNGGCLLTVESGGTYTSENTLEYTTGGTQREGGPTAASGSPETASVRLLQPGDGIEYTVTNESGGEVDASVIVDWVEVDRE